MNIQYKKYLPTFLFVAIIAFVPSFASAGIYLVSGNGAEVGRENCVVVMDDGTIYEGTSGDWDFGGMSVESAARLCLGFVPSGIIVSVDEGSMSGWDAGSKYTVEDVPNLNNTISYPLLVPTNLSLNTNILIAESSLKTLGLFNRAPDGIFDRASAEAVKKFQKSVSLPMTGNIDKLTWLLLLTR